MDPFSSSLQVPDSSPGPSRHAGRPVSVQPTSTASATGSSGRKRASHNVVTGQQEKDEQPVYRDIYSHPAALEYAAAHPRRTIPKFGPYLLLQTLGEGEFGKVKLGLHMQWGEEVAVKLIRRGNIDTSVRMSKVEREIEVLRTLKHPNIVRLYDVIETDKYIGIILEYASGGELFDHILAHRYLREKDACKLFSQLLSGVWYIHQKKIVHRDLKLENLLLDRNRNVIITDFGFANRFEHRADDLMQTSCGSPCYAAPELVISDGLYVGSAVDIWSCGVILYAMLAGYLPFDDDPANPDGDNINLLYKYIVNTPLSFPEYVSAEARDLLSIMLVPDPKSRADLRTIMAHPWLAPYSHLFSKSVIDLEQQALQQHQQKRLAYQKQMKQASVESPAAKMSRSQSSRTDGYSNGASSSATRSQSHRDPRRQEQPEYLYETSADQTMYSSPVQNASRRGFNSTIVMPTAAPVDAEDDPFAPTPMLESPVNGLPAVASPISNPRAGQLEEQNAEAQSPAKNGSPESKRPKGGFRHTIQVEYGESDGKDQKEQRSGSVRSKNGVPPPAVNGQKAGHTPKRPSVDAVNKTLPTPPPSAFHAPVESRVVPSTPTSVPPIEVTPVSPPAEKEMLPGPGSSDSASSKASGHRRGISISKLFGGSDGANGAVSRTPSQSHSQKSSNGGASPYDTLSKGDVRRRPSTMQVSPTSPTAAPTPAQTGMLSPDVAQQKKSRRNTLTIMVEPLRNSIKSRSKKTATPVETPAKEAPRVPDKESEREAAVVARQPAPIVTAPPMPRMPKELPTPATPQFAGKTHTQGLGAPPSAMKEGLAVPASTVKANRVMQWFRSKSTRRGPSDDAEGMERSYVVEHSGPPTADMRAPFTPGNSGFIRTVTGAGGVKAQMRFHHGAVDQDTVTTGLPPDVMKQVRRVLQEMGVDVESETEWKYRCVRPKRRKTGTGVGLGFREAGSSLAAFTIVGTAASNGVDKRGLPMPPTSHSAGSGGRLRGLLMRRQSSQVSTSSQTHGHSPLEGESPDAILAAAAPGGSGTDPSSPVPFETIYGDNSQDQGGEVRFSVELTRLDRLEGMYSLDIRRLKGDLRSYKFLYDTLRQRTDLQR